MNTDTTCHIAQIAQGVLDCLKSCRESVGRIIETLPAQKDQAMGEVEANIWNVYIVIREIEEETGKKAKNLIEMIRILLETNDRERFRSQTTIQHHRDMLKVWIHGLKLDIDEIQASLIHIREMVVHLTDVFEGSERRITEVFEEQLKALCPHLNACSGVHNIPRTLVRQGPQRLAQYSLPGKRGNERRNGMDMRTRASLVLKAHNSWI